MLLVQGPRFENHWNRTTHSTLDKEEMGFPHPRCQSRKASWNLAEVTTGPAISDQFRFSIVCSYVSSPVCPFLFWKHGPDVPGSPSADTASPLGMDPSRRYPLWYKNTVSLWILFGMAWLALIIKLILSLMETPGRSYSCYHHSSKEDFKPQSWRQGPEGEAEPYPPQPGCYTEGSVGATPPSEPSAQVSCCGKDG